ncbi:alpha/beta fold hydrolase [Nocardia sp. NPDC006630]|uniref:alpha/beta fold hydrolase n=1 Tax=Nocardia sp. NPDC006630 TaxID=3157181 RepID=UPI0033A05C1A
MRSVVLAALVVVSTATVTAAVSTAQPPDLGGPGTIVQSQPLPESELITNSAKGFRIVYRTTGQSGEPEVSGGDVFLPAGTPPPGGWRVISWAHGTIGMTPGCAPNLDGGMAGDFNERPELSTYLAQGYAVEATDYIGLGAPGFYEYLAARADGHAVLDIVRAAHTLDPGLSESYVLAGHSIGGHSVLAGAQVSPSYAPELDLRGTVAYAPTSNVEDLISALARPGVPALPFLDGFKTRLLMSVAGLDHARPDLHLTDYLTPLGNQLLAIAETAQDCGTSFESAAATQPTGQLFTKPLSDPAITEALRDYLTVPAAGFRQPVLLLQGAADTLQPIPTTLLLQQQLQQGATDSQLLLYPAATHFTVLQQSDPDTASFLSRVLPTH